MDRLYYLTEEPLTQINRLLPPEQGGRGRPPKSRHREALEGLVHLLRTGTPWRDVPQEYGAWHTIDRRWQRWVERGVWWQLLRVLTRLQRIALHLVFLDSTVVRAPQQAAGAPKKRGPKPLAARVGGRSTKRHTLGGSESDAVALRIPAGQVGDAPVGEALIDAIDMREELAQAAMDKAYASHALRAKWAAKGMEPVMPPKAKRREIIASDKEQYTQRNKVERLFNKLKQCRRVATRYEKLTAMFLGFVLLALIVIMLR